MLSVAKPFKLSVVMLNIILLNVILLNVILLYVILLNVIMLSVVMPNVTRGPVLAQLCSLVKNHFHVRFRTSF